MIYNYDVAYWISDHQLLTASSAFKVRWFVNIFGTCFLFFSRRYEFLLLVRPGAVGMKIEWGEKKIAKVVFYDCDEWRTTFQSKQKWPSEIGIDQECQRKFRASYYLFRHHGTRNPKENNGKISPSTNADHVGQRVFFTINCHIPILGG